MLGIHRAWGAELGLDEAPGPTALTAAGISSPDPSNAESGKPVPEMPHPGSVQDAQVLGVRAPFSVPALGELPVAQRSPQTCTGDRSKCWHHGSRATSTGSFSFQLIN